MPNTRNYKKVGTIEQSPGIIGCPHCKNRDKKEVAVTDSRVHNVEGQVTIRRRRACMKCAGEWETVEVPIATGEYALKELAKRRAAIAAASKGRANDAE